MLGGVLSIRTVSVFAASWFPALSTPKYVRVVVPSAARATEAVLPLTTPPPPCAPVKVKWISLTPVPPGSLSVEASVIVTFVLFQPLVLGLGEGLALVVGGIVSAATPTLA